MKKSQLSWKCAGKLWKKYVQPPNIIAADPVQGLHQLLSKMQLKYTLGHIWRTFFS